jgi:hypothetical protein
MGNGVVILCGWMQVIVILDTGLWEVTSASLTLGLMVIISLVCNVYFLDPTQNWSRQCVCYELGSLYSMLKMIAMLRRLTGCSFLQFRPAVPDSSKAVLVSPIQRKMRRSAHRSRVNTRLLFHCRSKKAKYRNMYHFIQILQMNYLSAHTRISTHRLYYQSNPNRYYIIILGYLVGQKKKKKKIKRRKKSQACT